MNGNQYATSGDRRWAFDRNAARYADGRPPYPARVYQLMEGLGALGPGTRVLEIGPGTGQATRELLARGATVDAIELGPGLAAILRDRLADGRLSVMVGDIQSITLPESVYDTVAVATAFHHLDAKSILPRIAGALRPGGWLVVWWTVFGDPEASTPFRRRVDQLFRQRLPDQWRPPGEIPRPMHVEERIGELTRDGHFIDPVHELIRWTAQLNRNQVRALFASFSNLSDLPPEPRETFLDALADAVDAEGGVIDDPYVTAIYAVRSAR